MRKSFLFPLLMGIIFFVSCTTENLLQNQNSQNSAIIELSKRWTINNSDSLVILKGVQKIDWDNAVVSNTDKGEILEVPLILKNNLKVSYLETNNEVNNKLLFIKEASGKLNAYQMMIATKDKISSTDPSLSFSNLNSSFDGYVAFVNSSNKTVDLLPSVHRSKPSLTGREIESCTYLVQMYDDDTYRIISLLFCTYGGGTQANHGGGGGGGGAGAPGKANPCDQLKAQNVNADFKAKLLELLKKTGLKIETGYSQNMDGTFRQLTNNGNDELNFAINATTMGFVHTHLDSYETGKYNSDGEPEIRTPIKMFSPADVKSFIGLINNANRNQSGFDPIYGTVITSSATYTLKFNGNYNDINQGLVFNDALNSQYKNDLLKNGLESGFLKFLNDNGIKGISLYKVNTDGTSEKKSLDSNNNIVTTPCN